MKCPECGAKMNKDETSWECPECGNKFYGGGRAMHKKGCSKPDYSGPIYHYSRKEMEGALKDYAPNSPQGFIEKLRHQ